MHTTTFTTITSPSSEPSPFAQSSASPPPTPRSPSLAGSFQPLLAPQEGTPTSNTQGGFPLAETASGCEEGEPEEDCVPTGGREERSSGGAGSGEGQEENKRAVGAAEQKGEGARDGTGDHGKGDALTDDHPEPIPHRHSNRQKQEGRRRAKERKRAVAEALEVAKDFDRFCKRIDYLNWLLDQEADVKHASSPAESSPAPSPALALPASAPSATIAEDPHEDDELQKSSAGEPPKLQVFVKDLQNNTLVVKDLTCTSTVYDVAVEVWQRTGVIPDEQLLMARGKVLDFPLLLKDYGIGNDSTVWLSIRLLGGAKRSQPDNTEPVAASGRPKRARKSAFKSDDFDYGGGASSVYSVASTSTAPPLFLPALLPPLPSSTFASHLLAGPLPPLPTSASSSSTGSASTSSSSTCDSMTDMTDSLAPLPIRKKGPSARAAASQGGRNRGKGRKEAKAKGKRKGRASDVRAIGQLEGGEMEVDDEAGPYSEQQPDALTAQRIEARALLDGDDDDKLTDDSDSDSEYEGEESDDDDGDGIDEDELVDNSRYAPLTSATIVSQARSGLTALFTSSSSSPEAAAAAAENLLRDVSGTGTRRLAPEARSNRAEGLREKLEQNELALEKEEIPEEWEKLARECPELVVNGRWRKETTDAPPSADLAGCANWAPVHCAPVGEDLRPGEGEAATERDLRATGLLNVQTSLRNYIAKLLPVDLSGSCPQNRLYSHAGRVLLAQRQALLLDLALEEGTLTYGLGSDYKSLLLENPHLSVARVPVAGLWGGEGQGGKEDEMDKAEAADEGEPASEGGLTGGGGRLVEVDLFLVRPASDLSAPGTLLVLSPAPSAASSGHASRKTLNKLDAAAAAVFALAPRQLAHPAELQYYRRRYGALCSPEDSAVAYGRWVQRNAAREEREGRALSQEELVGDSALLAEWLPGYLERNRQLVKETEAAGGIRGVRWWLPAGVEGSRVQMAAIVMAKKSAATRGLRRKPAHELSPAEKLHLKKCDLRNDRRARFRLRFPKQAARNRERRREQAAELRQRKKDALEKLKVEDKAVYDRIVQNEKDKNRARYLKEKSKLEQLQKDDPAAYDIVVLAEKEKGQKKYLKKKEDLAQLQMDDPIEYNRITIAKQEKDQKRHLKKKEELVQLQMDDPAAYDIVVLAKKEKRQKRRLKKKEELTQLQMDDPIEYNRITIAKKAKRQKQEQKRRLKKKEELTQLQMDDPIEYARITIANKEKEQKKRLKKKAQLAQLKKDDPIEYARVTITPKQRERRTELEKLKMEQPEDYEFLMKVKEAALRSLSRPDTDHLQASDVLKQRDPLLDSP